MRQKFNENENVPNGIREMEMEMGRRKTNLNEFKVKKAADCRVVFNEIWIECWSERDATKK